jgi:calcineurin-like phosphoesterase
VRALFIGDVVGSAAVACLVDRVPRLRAELALDVVVERLHAAGVDVATAGNHAFGGPEVAGVLAVPRVLRPRPLGRPPPPPGGKVLSRRDDLELGTALVTGVGMTGPAGGIEGFDASRYVEIVRGTPREAAPPVRVAGGPIVLGAVLLDIAAGRATEITRVT